MFDVDDEEVKRPRSGKQTLVEPSAMSEKKRAALRESFSQGVFSFHLMYFTRHGARFLLLLDREVTPQEYQRLALAFATLLQDELTEHLPEFPALKVDNTHDLARRFFAPRGVFGKKGFSYNGKKHYRLNEKVTIHPKPESLLSIPERCLEFAERFGPKILKPVTLQREKEEVELQLPPFPTEVFPPELEKTFQEFGATVHGPGQGRDFAALIGLSVISGAIGNRLSGYVGSHRARCSNWFCMVAPTGSGKSMLSNAMLQPLQKTHLKHYENWQSERKEFHQLRRERSLPEDAQEPSAPNEYVVSGITTVPSLCRALLHSPMGTLLDIDELPSFLELQKPHDRATFLTLHGGRFFNVKRGGFKEQQTTLMKNYNLSVLAGVQGAKLPELNLQTEDGLANRFLWAVLQPSPGYGTRLSTDTSLWWSDFVQSCLDLPVESTFETETAAEDFVRETIISSKLTAQRLQRAGLSHEAQFYSKAGLHFANLTCLLWGIECALDRDLLGRRVPLEVCVRARRLVDCFLHHSIEVYRLACSPETGAWEKGQRTEQVRNLEEWFALQYRDHGEFTISRKQLVSALAQSGIDEFLHDPDNQKQKMKKMRELGKALKGVESKGHILLRLYRSQGESRVDVKGVRERRLP
jgi:hypothetical protein